MIYSEKTHWQWYYQKMVVEFHNEQAKVAKLQLKVTELKQEIEILKEELNEQNSRKD